MTHCVVGIGEILWDRFPDGDRLGGASANFAFHAGQLGASARIISRIGVDDDSRRLIDLLGQCDLSLEHIQHDATRPTGLVRVKLQDGQPSYVIESPAAWDHIEMTDVLKRLAAKLDAVCFGTLAQRHPDSRRTIQDFIRLCPRRALRLFDINLRQKFFAPETVGFGLSQATGLKMNNEEVAVLAGLMGWSATPEKTPAEIFRRYPVEWIALTRGAEGCEIHTRDPVVCVAAPKVICVEVTLSRPPWLLDCWRALHLKRSPPAGTESGLTWPASRAPCLLCRLSF